ncbi:MAG: hypothetical protein M1819_005849 [Sarea resinae]|nr:MAG: hypothetical protein M1819_005849 [Sarea resinae]
MKAFTYEKPEGLVLKEIPIPQAGPGQVLLAIEAAGLCHSDTLIAAGRGDGFIHKQPPIVLGHEVAGTVIALGPGVTQARLGDRVAVAQIVHPISEVDWSQSIGLGYDGGYAQYALAPVTHLVQLPDNVSFEQAAVATDSIATAYHAIMVEGQITAGMTVVVIGLGGLGSNGVKIAALHGATVYGVDIDTVKFEGAKQNGAVECFSSLSSLPDVPIDVIADFAGIGTTTSDAIAAVKAGGRVVLVGLGNAEFKLSVTALVARNIELRGSIGSGLKELAAVIELIANRSLLPVVEEVPFAQVREGLERLDRPGVLGRMFTRPNKT